MNASSPRAKRTAAALSADNACSAGVRATWRLARRAAAAPNSRAARSWSPWPPATAEGDAPHAVERERDAALVAQLSPDRQALLEERLGRRVIVLGERQQAQTAQGEGGAALVTQLALDRQAGLVERPRCFVVALV